VCLESNAVNRKELITSTNHRNFWKGKKKGEKKKGHKIDGAETGPILAQPMMNDRGFAFKKGQRMGNFLRKGKKDLPTN